MFVQESLICRILKINILFCCFMFCSKDNFDFFSLALVTESVQEVHHDPPPQYSAQAPTGPEQQLESYPGHTIQPYTQQPPYPGQAFIDPNTRVVVPVIPTPVAGVNDYFMHNILVLVFCCLPIGIVGVIKSTECKNAIAVGDAARAERLSSEAKKLAIAGCVCGSVLIALIVIFYIVLYAAAGVI